MPQAVTGQSGLYLHVPFCHAKCFYCDFYSMRSADGDMPKRFVDMAVSEITARVGKAPRSVYIGGGTPSALHPLLLDRLFEAIDTSASLETTIEVNPEDVSKEFCRWLRTSPVTRVSMGIQSLIDAELRTVGRRHTAAEAVRAVDMLRSEADIHNLSLDLIYGLPGSDIQSWRYSLEGLLRLEPEHLSAYLLSYEPRTRLNAMLNQGKVSECPSELAEQMYLALCELAYAQGYSHYEISNFARSGYEAIHNSSYWDSTPYTGIGPGAHSYDGAGCRKAHASDLKRYVDSGWMSTLTIEVETEAECFNDFLITRLRTARGIDMTDCLNRFGADRVKRLSADAQRSLQLGDLVADNAGLHIPECRMLVADSIIVQLIQD